MYDYLQTLAIRQFAELDTKIRLVVIHPSFIQQHTLLSYFLDHTVAYVSFEGEALTQEQLKNQLEQSLQQQELQLELSSDFMLLLDECDRAISDDLTGFLSWLIENNKSQRIILFTRSIPQYILENSNLSQITAFLPKEQSLMLWDYTDINSQTTLLEVRAFGEGHVLLNGKEIDNWDGLLPRALFFYLVDRGMATRNEIFETFWPNLPKREATNVFHVTKRKISEVLGIDLTTYWSGFYRISPDIQLSYDAILFTEMVQNSAIATAEKAIELLEQAIGLYQSPFLSSLDNAWAQRRRYELALDYSEALVSLGRAKEETGQIEEALGLYQRATVDSDQREDIILTTMRLYHELGMGENALSIYRNISESILNNGIPPNDQIKEFAETIQKQMERAASK